MTPDRVLEHLANWVSWQCAEVLTGGYPSRSSGLSCGNGRDFDAALASSNARCAEAVDSILWSLPDPWRAAVHHAQLEAVYCHSEPFAEAYAFARQAIGRGLDRRGVV